MLLLLFISFVLLPSTYLSEELDVSTNEQTNCQFNLINYDGTNFFESTPENLATFDEAVAACRICLNRGLANVPNPAVQARSVQDQEVLLTT